MMVWSFWYNRNKWHYDQVNCDLRRSIAYAFTLHKCFKESMLMSSLLLSQQGKSTLPPESYLKLNVDGALFFNRNEVGVGTILRDTQGNTCLTANILEDRICDLEYTEYVAT